MLAAAALLLPCAWAQAQEADDYAAMLGWLAETRIEERAFAGASGAIAVNMAAGDLNQQANLRSLAVGDGAHASASARQRSLADVADAPHGAAAVIGGRAFAGASGMVSINQASGSGNAELNAIAVTLAQQGIRETSDEQLSSPAFASAGLEHRPNQGEAETVDRKVAVDASALQGFEGVFQLNQIAGSGNAADNHFVMSVQTVP
ncbi:hypothetical protein H0E84_01300 [Luteimonas sp. SJ-92]|uniref:Fap amyloid fibril minor component n=1 Tax=Luteimonas salinisoli TaxID=2752307 RepID=A0A853J8N3_9GAMM|nr:hypothetical protein [Luteimonas salinisoli]